MRHSGKDPLLLRGVDPTPRWTRNDLILIAVLMLAGLLLRIPGINQGLWVDEINTLVNLVRYPAADIINLSGRTNNHVLYSLLAHYCVAWFGESAWALRLPALIFGVAIIPAIYHFGRQITSRPEAFLAALLLALNYQFIWYSQNARGYTGVLFGALLASSLFIRLIATANPPVRIVLGYAVTAALTCWMQMMAVFLVLAHVLIWMGLAVDSLSERRTVASTPAFVALALTTLFTVALYSPMFYADTVQHVRLGNGTSSFVEESAANQWVFEEFIRGVEQSMPGGWLAVAIVFAALLAGLVSYARQGRSVLNLLTLPALVTIFLVTSMGSLFFPRFLFCSAGFLLLIGVRGGFKLAEFVLPILSPRHVLMVGMLFALAGASQVPSAWGPKQDYAAAAEFIRENQRPGDAVVCFSITSFPLTEFHGMDCEDTYTLAQLVRIENRHERTWLLYTLPTQAKLTRPEVWARINTPSEYKLIREFKGTLNGGTITVMLRQNTTTRNELTR